MNDDVRCGDGEVPTRRQSTLNLDQQEREIVSLTVQGLNDREIAARMTITKQEAQQHLLTIFDKLGVSDRLELVLYILGSPTEALPDTRSVAPEKERELYPGILRHRMAVRP